MSDDDKRVVVDQFTQQAAPFREFAAPLAVLAEMKWNGGDVHFAYPIAVLLASRE